MGVSAAALSVIARILQVARTTSTVLLCGETGVGKQVVAEDIHRCSARADKPFEVADCASLPEDLAYSELFGHERGAFTGAVAQFRGAFERAVGGTIFVDEVGELSPRMQLRLLRVLEARAFTRLHGTELVPMTARVVVATHRDLQAMVRAGEFREDLYYRLAVLLVKVPPLRERLDDLPILIDVLMAGFDPRVDVAADGVAELAKHHWPGNVRELRNVLENLAASSDSKVAGAREVRLHAGLGGCKATPNRPASRNELFDAYLGDPTLGDKRRPLLRDYALRALELTGGRVDEAAELMGVSRHTVRRLRDGENGT